MTHPVIKMILKKINVLQKVCTKKRCLALLSLISTPFIIFTITSVELYLKNKIDLDNKLIVLAPFFILFLLAIIIGCFFTITLKRTNLRNYSYLSIILQARLF